MLNGICCMEVYIKNLSKISFNMIKKCWIKWWVGLLLPIQTKKWVTGVSCMPGFYVTRLLLTCSELRWYQQRLFLRPLFLLMDWLLAHIIKVERYLWCINCICRESSGVFKEWFLAVKASTLSPEQFQKIAVAPHDFTKNILTQFGSSIVKQSKLI